MNVEEIVENLSDEERDHFLEAFNQIDTNKTGTIDKHELGAFLALHWRHAVPNETIDNIITLVDDNRDGKIQFDEFVILQLKYIPICRGYCKDCKKIIIGMSLPFWGHQVGIHLQWSLKFDEIVLNERKHWVGMFQGWLQWLCAILTIPLYILRCSIKTVVVVGDDGYTCPKCVKTAKDGTLIQGKSFTVCSMCAAKTDKVPHRHPYSVFLKLDKTPVSASGEATAVVDRGLKSNESVQRRFVQHVLEQNYKRQQGYWGGAVDCLVQ